MTIGQVRVKDLPDTGSIAGTDTVLVDAAGGTRSKTISELSTAISAGIVLPFGIFDGTGVTIVVQNGMIASIVRTTAEAAGVYDITLNSALSVTGTYPTVLQGQFPFVDSKEGLNHDVSVIGFGGTPYSYTQVRVTLKNSGGTKTDGKFTLTFRQI